MSEDVTPIITHLGSGLVGALITILVTHYLTKSREKEKSAASDSKERLDGVARWLRDLRGVTAGLKAEIVRAELPSDWYPSFEASVIELRRLTAIFPTGLDSKRKDEITTIVDRLFGMTSSEAVHGVQQVADMLETLEGLTNAAS